MTPSRVTIRRAVAADFEAIRELEHMLDTEHGAAAAVVFRAPDAPRFTRAAVLEWLASDARCLLVAENQGTIVGFLDACVEWPTAPDDTPGSRRTGIGTALMQAAETWAREHGLPQVRLEVFAFNVGARTLYERLGYRTYAQRMLKVLDAAMAEDETDAPSG